MNTIFPKRFLIWIPIVGLMAMAANAQNAFTRGAAILFEDNLQLETIGEFPSRWTLRNGNAEVARHNSDNVLSFLVTRTETEPSMDQDNYLPDEFTIDFDYLMNHYKQHSYELRFLDASGRRSATLRFNGESCNLSAARGGGNFSGDTPESSSNFKPGWKHFALSFNQREMRIFIDGSRVLVVPDFDVEMRRVVFMGGRPANSRPNGDAFISNVVIAEGAMPLYERVMSEGRFVTSDILFDVNRAEIRPESQPVIDQIFQLMQSYPELRFSVDGHTDSDGDAALNEQLSQQRAESVRQRLIDMGINADRLTAKGFGESNPVADNATNEGKAKNRRVEFVKI